MAQVHATIPIEIRPKTRGRKFIVEMDIDRFERLVAGLGLFRREFLESVARAEGEVAQGKVKRLRSLRELRRS